MIQIAPQQHATLDKYNAEFRFTHRGPTFKDGPREGDKPIQLDPGHVRCEIIDRTIKGEPYCFGVGSTESEALVNALTKIKDAPKPITPAQRADALAAAAGEIKGENAALKSRIAELESQLTRGSAPAELTVEPPPVGANRPKK